MAFPNTRRTLISRLAQGGSQQDWREFLDDYWGPVCRFAMRRGSVPLGDAEEIASESLEVVLRRKLLGKWNDQPRAKLRTLLCGVVCRVQANYHRAANRRDALAEKYAEESSDTVSANSNDDVFYAAWVEEFLQKCLNDLVAGYHREGKGDYVRVLYGRLCEGMSIAEVADALDIKRSDVDNFYRHAKKRLTDALRSAVQSDVARYASEGFAVAEFESEWRRLADFLSEHGGLEEAVRNAEQFLASAGQAERQRQGVDKAMTSLGL